MPDPHCQKYPRCYGAVLLSVYLRRYSAKTSFLSVLSGSLHLLAIVLREDGCVRTQHCHTHLRT